MIPYSIFVDPCACESWNLDNSYAGEIPSADSGFQQWTASSGLGVELPSVPASSVDTQTATSNCDTWEAAGQTDRCKHTRIILSVWMKSTTMQALTPDDSAEKNIWNTLSLIKCKPFLWHLDVLAYVTTWPWPWPWAVNFKHTTIRLFVQTEYRAELEDSEDASWTSIEACLYIRLFSGLINSNRLTVGCR